MNAERETFRIVCRRCGRDLVFLVPPVPGPDGELYRWRCPAGGLQEMGEFDFLDWREEHTNRLPPFQEHDEREAVGRA